MVLLEQYNFVRVSVPLSCQQLVGKLVAHALEVAAAIIVFGWIEVEMQLLDETQHHLLPEHSCVVDGLLTPDGTAQIVVVAMTLKKKSEFEFQILYVCWLNKLRKTVNPPFKWRITIRNVQGQSGLRA